MQTRRPKKICKTRHLGWVMKAWMQRKEDLGKCTIFAQNGLGKKENEKEMNGGTIK
jgi:hypothetical protein